MMDNRVRANQQIPKYRIYKGHRRSSRGGRRVPRCWWKLAFMQIIIDQRKTFEEIIQAFSLQRQKVRELRVSVGLK